MRRFSGSDRSGCGRWRPRTRTSAKRALGRGDAGFGGLQPACGQEAGVAAQRVVEVARLGGQLGVDVGHRLQRFGGRAPVTRWKRCCASSRLAVSVMRLVCARARRPPACSRSTRRPARFGALADLLERFFVQRIVLARQQLHVASSAAGRYRPGWRPARWRRWWPARHKAGQLVETGLLDVIAGAEAVENQLAQFRVVARRLHCWEPTPGTLLRYSRPT